MKKHTTTISGRVYNDVILTEGGCIRCSDGKQHQIAGVFATEDDARSMSADDLALAIVRWDELDAEAQAIARANSEEV